MFAVILNDAYLEHDTYDLFDRVMQKMEQFFLVSERPKVFFSTYPPLSLSLLTIIHPSLFMPLVPVVFHAWIHSCT